MLTWRHKEARHEGAAVQLRHLTQPILNHRCRCRKAWINLTVDWFETCLLYSVRDMLWPCRAGCSPRWCRPDVCMGEGSQILIRFGAVTFSLTVCLEKSWNSSFIFLFPFWILYVHLCLHLASEYLLSKNCNDCILWTGLTNCGNGWYLSMLLGVYAGIISKKNMNAHIGRPWQGITKNGMLKCGTCSKILPPGSQSYGRLAK